MGKLKPRLVLKVNNLEDTVHFYQDIFKWEEEWKDEKKSIVQVKIPYGGVVLFVKNADTDISEYTDVSFIMPKPGQRFYLIGEKVDKIKNILKEKQIKFESEVDPGFGQSVMLEDPIGYIATHWEELHMSDEDILSLYKSGPDQLELLLMNITNDQLDLVRAEGKWSIRQTVLHLIDSDITMFHRIKFALAEPGRVYHNNPYDPNHWELETEYRFRSIHTEVSLFRLIREHILNLCGSLPNALERTILTNDRGELTVRKMIKMVAGHAKGHIKQIEETKQIHRIK